MRCIWVWKRTGTASANMFKSRSFDSGALRKSLSGGNRANMTIAWDASLSSKEHLLSVCRAQLVHFEVFRSTVHFSPRKWQCVHPSMESNLSRSSNAAGVRYSPIIAIRWLIDKQWRTWPLFYRADSNSRTKPRGCYRSARNQGRFVLSLLFIQL